jgi:hypothetical protein
VTVLLYDLSKRPAVDQDDYLRSDRRHVVVSACGSRRDCSIQIFEKIQFHIVLNIAPYQVCPLGLVARSADDTPPPFHPYSVPVNALLTLRAWPPLCFHHGHLSDQ